MEIDRETIVRTFLDETSEGLDDLEDALVELETRPRDTGLVETVFRVVHTLKGNAVSLEFAALAGFADVLEDLLETLRAGTRAVDRELVTALLEAVDALRELVVDAGNGIDELGPGHVALLVRLRPQTNPAGSEIPATTAASPEHTPAPRRNASPSERAATLRVDIEKLDRMLDLTGEIAIARGRLREAVQVLPGGGPSTVREALEETERLQLALQEHVMKLRMVPVGPTFQKLVRVVRDLAVANGKLARLRIEGADVEVDASILEHLRDPLIHMVRNAIAHGIERPSTRELGGKDPCGTVTLRASHETGRIVVELSDDGSGLDHGRIRARAEELGWLSPSDEPSIHALEQLVFEPGFSTARSVDALSGRGVGMDVVRRNVEAVRGTIRLASRPGRGTTLTLRLPLTVAIIEGFAVGVADDTYVIPLEDVIECLELPADARERRARTGILDLRGQAVPFLRLRETFGVSEGAPARENVVVLRSHGTRMGIVADTLHGASQTVIKSLGTIFQGVPGIAGGAILGSGRVALVLDVPALLRDALGRDAIVSDSTSEPGAPHAPCGGT